MPRKPKSILSFSVRALEPVSVSSRILLCLGGVLFVSANMLIYHHSLAWMEFYLIFANFFDRLDMSLWKTDDDTTQWRDNGNSALKEEVKVMVDDLKKG